MHRLYKYILIFVLLTIFELFAISSDGSASWLSDITGIDINVPRGTINFGIPRPDRIPQMLQNLPKDASQFFLNPVGSALAFAIRQAKEQAKDGCRPVPQQIVRDLSPFFPPEIFAGVCWNDAGQRFSIDRILLNDFNQGAVTLEDVIVFKNLTDGETNSVLWAHELMHVMQYRRLGLETFAHLYTFSFQQLEGEAKNLENFVASRLNSDQVNQRLWTGQWTNQAIPTQTYQSWSKQTINAYSCSRMVWHTPDTITIENFCPIPIQVTGFALQNWQGFQQQMPCHLPTCAIGPGNRMTWPDPPGLRTVNAWIDW